MYAIEKNINRKIGTEVENKGSKDNAILQTMQRKGVLDSGSLVDLMRCRLVLPKKYWNRYQ